MIKLEHVAIWVRDLDRTRDFYVEWFGMTSSTLYESSRRPFRSYFLTPPAGGARLELMTMPQLAEPLSGESLGYAHVAFSVGSRGNVDEFTEKAKLRGVPVHSEPRVTGDGYYESVILDSEGNLIEITE